MCSITAAAIGPYRVILAARGSPFFFVMPLGLWGALVHYVEVGRELIFTLMKTVLGSADFLAHLLVLLVVNLLAGALGIRHYEHFLRLRFEPEQVTIYPIAIDKVPGRRGWRAASAGERAQSPPLIVPKDALKPRLIEEPIPIKVADVRHRDGATGRTCGAGRRARRRERIAVPQERSGAIASRRSRRCIGGGLKAYLDVFERVWVSGTRMAPITSVRTATPIGYHSPK